MEMKVSFWKSGWTSVVVTLGQATTRRLPTRGPWIQVDLLHQTVHLSSVPFWQLLHVLHATAFFHGSFFRAASLSSLASRSR